MAMLRFSSVGYAPRALREVLTHPTDLMTVCVWRGLESLDAVFGDYGLEFYVVGFGWEGFGGLGGEGAA